MVRTRFLLIALMLALPGCTLPLLKAADGGHTDRLSTLLDEGRDANAAIPLLRTTPLILAAAGGHAETARALLDRGADVNGRDLTGWTALHAAAYNGNAQVVRLLLEHGAVIHPSTWYLPNATEVARRLGRTEALTVLEEAAKHERYTEFAARR